MQEKSLTFWLTVCYASQLSQFNSNSVVAGVWPWSSVTVWVSVVRCLKHNTNDSPWGRMYALYYVCTYTWTVSTAVYHKQESITVWRCGRFGRWTRLLRIYRYDGTTRRERGLCRPPYNETRSPLPLPRFRARWESWFVLFVPCSGGWKVRLATIAGHLKHLNFVEI